MACGRECHPDCPVQAIEREPRLRHEPPSARTKVASRAPKSSIAPNSCLAPRFVTSPQVDGRSGVIAPGGGKLDRKSYELTYATLSGAWAPPP